MTNSLMLPLRLPASRGRAEDTLQSRIFQIYSQKGAFRDVTEASLAAEIRSQRQQDEDTKMVEDEESENEAEEPEDRYQTLTKSREEMLQQLRRAQNDTLMALDFISSLLSKFAPTTAQSTMSSALKDAVPIGSLDAGVINHTPSAPEAKSVELVSRAYKLQGFSYAASSILGAASKLEVEAAKETTYWDQILSIKQKGWSVSRVPRDPRTLGVHFGFRDAAPAFRTRGFAALRRNTDGSLLLDQGAVPSRPVAVQVSIVRNGQNSGTSAMPYARSSNERDIYKQILGARNTLYEEELFHELGREARLLANQGATMSSRQIEIPMDEHAQMQIDLIDLDGDATSSPQGPDQQLADGIATALRILLSHAHEQNLQRRSQPPPPMTLKQRPMPEYALIRPITAHLQHRSNVKSATTFLETITKPFLSAGIICHWQSSFHFLDPIVRDFPFFLSSTTNTTNTAVNPLDHHHLFLLTAALIEPPTTTLTVTLPTSRSIKITLHTNLNAPHFGTEYSLSPQPLTYPSSSSSSSPPNLSISLPRLSRHSELEAALRHILTIDLVHLIASTQADPEIGGAAAATDDAQIETKSNEQWIPLDPHSGTLSLEGKQQQQQQQKSLLFVKVWNDRLGLRHLRRARAGIGTSKREGVAAAYLWDGSGQVVVAGENVEGKIEKKGLLDIVREGMGDDGPKGN